MKIIPPNRITLILLIIVSFAIGMLLDYGDLDSSSAPIFTGNFSEFFIVCILLLILTRMFDNEE